jgi:NADPH-dependent curcumin reductase CurA
MNQTIILEKRPIGKPQVSDFKFVNEAMPEIGNDELLLKTAYVSVDPYLRGRMIDAKSYAAPFQLNEVISSGIVAEVIESKVEGFSKGDFVSGSLAWKEYQKSDGQGLNKVNPANAPLSAYLGVLGMTGLTAYLGLSEIGKLKAGETLVVSGAAGAVGSIVGQIGKLLGCRVVGIAGTDEKVAMLKEKYGFDEGINYNTTDNMKEAIANTCPDGVDVYFDNVGGSISDGVLANINKFARIVVCGSISVYNETTMPMGPRVESTLVKNSALMQGFIVGNYAAKFPEAITNLASWLKEGKLTYSETIVEGFEQIPQAFIGLFEGKNNGKMIVKI